MPPILPSQPLTIEELDRLLECGAMSRLCTTTFEQSFIQESPILAQLLYIKRLYSKHPMTEERFSSMKSTKPPDSDVHLKKYMDAFKSLNQQMGSPFGPSLVDSFLDLGCSPGGFSNWLVSNNPRATGLGVTLPNSEASWPMKQKGTPLDSSRYELRFANIVDLAMDSDSWVLRPEGFELVLACAFPSFQRVSLLQRVQLVMSEILLMLVNIKDNGNAVVLVNSKTFPWVAVVVTLLRRCFTLVRAGKGHALHKERSSCYLVCTGFCASRDTREEFIAQVNDSLDTIRDVLQKRQASKRFSPETGTQVGTDDADAKEDVDDYYYPDGTTTSRHLLRLFGRSDEVLPDEELKYFLALFEPVWKSQYDSIHFSYCKGIQELARRKEKQDQPGELQDCKPQIPRSPDKLGNQSWSPYSSSTIFPTSTSSTYHLDKGRPADQFNWRHRQSYKSPSGFGSQGDGTWAQATSFPVFISPAHRHKQRLSNSSSNSSDSGSWRATTNSSYESNVDRTSSVLDTGIFGRPRHQY
ncbi:hypothetical protein BC835DRAFT_1412088 [Cytidiella melzeri]|nr:hypothetical protein BC835DRAFT_1412088 [Cytidiella melzeri]